MSAALHADCFDASALVKLHIDEPGSDIIRPYFDGALTTYTTPFCFYETLSAFKAKLLKRIITKVEYLAAARRLTVWYGAATRRINDLDFSDHMTFNDAMRIIAKTPLDLSDAFQILSVRDGYFAPLVGDSKTVLVTADANLAQAARSEGLRVWYFMGEPAP